MMEFGFPGTSSFQDKQPIVTQPPTGADKGGNAGKGAATGAASGAMSGTMAYPGIGTIIGAVIGAAVGAAGGAMSKAGETPGSGPQINSKPLMDKIQPDMFSSSTPSPSGANEGMDQAMMSAFSSGQSPYSMDANMASGFGLGPYMEAGGGNPYSSLSPQMQQELQNNPYLLMQMFGSGGA